MKTTTRQLALLASVLGAMALAGCGAVQDVKSESFAELPAQTVVLAGKIHNLGTRRPVTLQYNGQDTCIQPADPNAPSGAQIIGECRFLGILNQPTSVFSFGALTVGTPYNITVKRQPFAKVCTVTNGTGTVGSNAPAPEVNCEDDPNIPRYAVTVNINPAVQNLEGLQVILQTEQKARAVPATGLTSYTFSYPDDDVFNNQTSLPTFGWRVTATVPGPTAVDPPRNCYVTGGPVLNTGGNIGDDGNATTAPVADVTVTVNSCGFTVRAQADFSVPTVVHPGNPTTTTPPAIPAGEAVTVLLREQPTGVTVAGATIVNFNNSYMSFMELDGAGNPTTTPYSAPSHENAFYEILVKSSPSGMSCIPGASVSSSSARTSTRAVASSWLDAGAILLRRPASARVSNLWIVDRVIRCRHLPVAERQLRGIYQQSTMTTTTPSGGAPALVELRNHNVLAFFEDGTYFYGNHLSSAANNGVEQGFYDYNPATQTIRFIGLTDTNGGQGIHAVATGGSAVGAPITKQVTGVQLVAGNPAVMNFNFTPTAVNSAGTATTVDWKLTEIGADPLVSSINPVDGAWVTWDEELQMEDRRRVFVYQHGLYNAFHMGVNGIGNLQEACYVGDFSLAGTWTRQGGRSGCHMRNYTLRNGETLAELVATFPKNCGFPAGAILPSTGGPVTSSCGLMSSGSSDIPNPPANGSLADYPGRWPQSRNPDFTDGRPYSLVHYELRQAGTDPADPICPNANKLTVWDTQHGIRKSELEPPIPPIVLCHVSVD